MKSLYVVRYECESCASEWHTEESLVVGSVNRDRQNKRSDSG